MNEDEKSRRRLAFFIENKDRFQKDPGYFARKVLGFTPDTWQEEALKALSSHARIAVKSGQGVGKTGTEAAALLWFLSCFPYARVVATAPTRQQLHDVLWAEAYKWLQGSALLSDILTWTKTRISMKKCGERWFAVARTATRPENMQGYHEKNMLFIIDEASGVADPIMEAILGTLSGENNKLLMCGNPTRTSGAFYDAFNADRAQYRLLTVSSRDSARTNKENILSLERKYGRDSNVVRVRVDGEFPNQEDDVFIGLSDIEQCCSKVYELPDDKRHKDIIFGIDVARFGGDETVLYRNAFGRLRIIRSRRGQDLMATVGDIVAAYRGAIQEFPEYGGRIYAQIDDTGLGGGVTDRLNEVQRERGLSRLFIVPINAAERIETDTLDGKEAAERFNNLTTHMWAALRDLLRGQEIEIEDDPDTVAQVSARKYRMASNGKIELESKADMKKRGVASPDRADAAALSVYRGKIRKYTWSAPGLDAVAALGKESYFR